MLLKITPWKNTTKYFATLFTSFYCALCFATAPALGTVPPQHTVAPMLKKAIPAVVHIQTVSVPPAGAENQKPQVGTGSGVIIDASKGYVITNWHVIKAADELMVMLDDGRTLPAKVLGGDAPTDVALIQISAPNLQVMPMGNSDKLQVGDFVLAIGNPFGLSQSVTSGIISGLGRSELGIEGYEDFIQTDASINPGNSGGALINFNGELIGINTAILGPNGANIGIGFAIPINMVRSVVDQLLEYGTVKRGVLGMVGQPVTPQLATAFGLSNTQGAVISHVIPESPAMTAGIKPGDVITTVNGHPVLSAHDLRNRLSLTPIGDSLSIALIRKGKNETITLTVQDPATLKTHIADIYPPLLGLETKPMHDTLPGHGEISGLAIISVIPGSPAYRFGFRPGDIILTANQKPVASLDDLGKAVAAKKKDEGLLLLVARGPSSSFVVVP